MKIIAEVGSNWTNFNDCMVSISLAKNCGADAVKFQLFTGEALYGMAINTVACALPVDWLPQLKEKADACGIEFMCSAFSPELIDAVDPYVKTHKVASAELTHVRMLEKLRTIGKPVILSTGGSGSGDIEMVLKVLGNTPVTLMYCVSEYPAREVYLERIKQLADTFGLPIGYSDHTTDVATIPRAAMMAAGATVIEKHVNFVNASGADAPHSLNTEEFKRMCQYMRHGYQAGWGPREHDMRTRYKRRLIAIKHIAKGDMLKENENFGIYRSLKEETAALSPWAVNDVHGQHALCDVKCGDGISLQVIKN